jgi:c-di-GMP-binding flagellar brake protein YcgR
MKERRKFVRISDNSLISYKVVSDAKFGDYFTKDISQSGIRFFTNEFVPKDSILVVRVTTKKMSFSFEALVRVVWIIEDTHKKRFEIGAEFTDIPEEAASHLVRYIKYVMESSGSLA